MVGYEGFGKKEGGRWRVNNEWSDAMDEEKRDSNES